MTWFVFNRVAVLVVAAATIVGCSDEDKPSATTANNVSGTVAGHSLAVRDTAGVRLLRNDGSLDLMVFAFEDRAGLCDLMRGPYEWASTGLSVTFSRTPLVAGAKMDLTFPPGTYTIGTPKQTADSEIKVTSSFYVTNKSCVDEIPESSRHASAGTVTIDSVDQGYVNGSLDLAFGADHVAASFKIPLCPLLWENVTQKRRCEP